MRLSLCLWLTLLAAPLTFAQEAATEVVPEATETVSQNARDYCGGQLTYTLPDGWAAGSITRTSNSVGQTIASSKDTLNKYASLLDPDESSVIIGVFDRTSFADSMNVAADADISTLLKGLLNAPTSLKFTLSAITPLTIGGHDAAQASGTMSAEYEDVILTAFDANTLGMVLLAANPNEQTRWNDTALALAESLSADDVPRFADAAGSLPLTQSFPTNDCSVVFGFPEGWAATQLSADGAPLFKVWLTNYETADLKSETMLGTGQARLELQITTANRVTGDVSASAEQLSGQIEGGQVISKDSLMLGNQQAQLIELQIKDGDQHIGDALILVRDNSDGSRSALTLYAAPGELDRWRATALAVAASLRVHLPSSN